MTAAKKPVLLLDVDGVLNIFGEAYAAREVRLDDGHAFYPSPFTRPFMRQAWREFDVIWCTAWRASANAIARWANLGRRPWIEIPQSAFDGDWKLAGVVRRLGRTTRRLVWLEDGISEEAYGWISEDHRRIYAGTDPREGVTPEIFLRIRRFAHVEGKAT